eukprot:TRINITY_DN3973_c3_g1_i1.p1 TRINITY_DN3973_c3_g1~~TRINITY_DN3973_c3_g1_i1.p1  ORF type:complete len:221 (+),score=48.27 TRINITY_DN3973_c3_g1_i1:153-815(+)
MCSNTLAEDSSGQENISPNVAEPQNVVILDWDDTLLCTTFLSKYEEDDIDLPKGMEKYIRGIERSARRLLEVSMSAGHTFIVTNAVDGWVQTSASRWVPGLLPLLKKVRIMTTRTKTGPRYSGTMSQWKHQAFSEVMQGLDGQSIQNLVAFGDSEFEIEAAEEQGKRLQRALVKTVKLKEAPSPQELQKELDFMVQKFDKIMNSSSCMALNLAQGRASSN